MCVGGKFLFLQIMCFSEAELSIPTEHFLFSLCLPGPGQVWALCHNSQHFLLKFDLLCIPQGPQILLYFLWPNFSHFLYHEKARYYVSMCIYLVSMPPDRSSQCLLVCHLETSTWGKLCSFPT